MTPLDRHKHRGLQNKLMECYSNPLRAILKRYLTLNYEQKYSICHFLVHTAGLPVVKFVMLMDSYFRFFIVLIFKQDCATANFQYVD